VRIGKSTNTSDITLGQAISASGPISIYGGNITVNQDLATTALGGSILVKGTGAIAVAASRTLTTNKGDIVLWSDSNGSGGDGAISPMASPPVACQAAAKS
jgi:hypothetical protein